ncbi:MAG: S41 family peptidase [Bacteroidales bacterium]|nr:S41 family peptidase [Bacteroidales bacterium]
MRKTTKLILPIIIAIAFVAGMLASLVLFQKNTTTINFNHQNNNKLNTIINYIENEYVDDVKLDSIIEITIPKFLKELDPHSFYFNPQDAKEVNEPLEGNFDGIGVQFNMHKDTLLIIEVISGGPSENIGILAGDRIIQVNDSVIAGVSKKSDDIIKLLKGPRGTKVNVKILRRGRIELLDFTITRDVIPIKSVDAYNMMSETTGYIKISSFSRTTHDEFVQACFILKSKGMQNLILDLRGNSGGYLDAATNIVDEFLHGGKLIVYTEGKARPTRNTYSSDKRNSCIDINLAVLIDEFSASASEVVAGAIQDNDRGWIVGRRSFGKGLVQESTMFNDGSTLRLTTARYYTPSGRCIQKNYSKGYENYYDEIAERFIHGEFSEMDSVEYSDTVKYKTSKGRIVYGGGGIMADKFIPFDTILFNPAYRLISDYGLSYGFALKYSDENREKFKKIKSTQGLINQLDKENTIAKFYAYLKENKIEFTNEDIKDVSELIKQSVYSYIIRNIRGESAFYWYVNKYDETCIEARRILETKEQLIKN